MTYHSDVIDFTTNSRNYDTFLLDSMQGYGYASGPCNDRGEGYLLDCHTTLIHRGDGTGFDKDILDYFEFTLR